MMPGTKEMPLDSHHSLGGDAQEQQQKPLVESNGTRFAPRQNQATQHPTNQTKAKKRMFSTPSLRISASASSAAAASAAIKIKSNLSSVTKLPTALKRPVPNRSSATNDDKKVPVDLAPTSSPRSSSSTESSTDHDEVKVAPRMFGIPSLMRLKSASKDNRPLEVTSDVALDSPYGQSKSNSGKSRDTDCTVNETEGSDECDAHMSAINSASRFVRGMPTLLRRAVTPDTSVKKSPDPCTSSILQGEPCVDDPENERLSDPENERLSDPENERLSLLLMLQVPQARRQSQVPLMAASETW